MTAGTPFTKEELRTIDALVTRFVMEYPTFDDADLAALRGGSNPLAPVEVSHLGRPPPWSCDESLALSVLRHLIAEGFRVVLEGYGDGWKVTLIYPLKTREGEFVEHKAVARKLSLAICLASLCAVGINALPS